VTAVFYIAPFPFNFTHLQSASKVIDWPFFLCHLHSASPSKSSTSSNHNDHNLQSNPSTSYDYGDIRIPSPSELSKLSNTAETSTFTNIIESMERRTHIRIHPQQLNERLHNGADITSDRQSQRDANSILILCAKHLTTRRFFSGYAITESPT
jgi:hypothetical protein